MSKTATVLVVEDEEALLEGIADLLQVAADHYQIHVLTATNGEEALEKMEAEPPDLIISDIMMPRMDGYEFLDRVRQNLHWVHIPFIFLTAKGKREDIMEGRRRGAELYITKPFSSIELKELVESQLNRTFALRDAREQELMGLKRDILQLLNHEFRTPLTYVTAYYEMLADSLDNLREITSLQDYLRGIQTGSKRLTNLVEDLIRIMEFRTGEAGVHFEQKARRITNIGDLLQRAGRSWEKEAETKGIAIIYDIAVDCPAVFGVADDLEDAFHRLIDNAIKFTPEGPDAEQKYVNLRLTADGQLVQISVEDQGIGFPVYVGDQLFDPFFQFNRQTLEQQGSGSGLAIVKGVVEMHGGRVEVTSVEGQGSTFCLLLPRYEDHQNIRALREHAPRQVQVLVVEDDRFLLAGLQELLEVFEGPYQIEVLLAENGREGLSVLEHHRPDLIISDVMMPVMDGYEFLEAVRRRPAYVQIPFIFLTARREKQDIYRGLVSGVEEYIPKPYDIDELLALVVTQLDRHFQMQVAANQSLEDMKRGILDLLRPDFMEPLSTVNEYTQKLRQELAEIKTEEDLKHSLEGIREASEKLTNLVEDFIAMAEFKTGEAEMNFVSRRRQYTGVELQSLLEIGVFDYQERAEKLGLNCHIDIPATLPAIECDLHNLILSLHRLFEFMVQISQSQGKKTFVFSVQSKEEMLWLGFHIDNVTLDQKNAHFLHQLKQMDEREIMRNYQFGPSLMVVKGVLSLHQGRLEVEQSADSVAVAMLLPVQPQENRPEGLPSAVHLLQ